MGVKKLTDEEIASWRLFRRTFDQVNRSFARAFAEYTTLSGPEFGVLDRLAGNGGQLRQQEIQETLRWEKDRLSHLLSRMTSRGLVERRRTQGLMVLITEAGREAHRVAQPIHWQAVRRSYLDPLNERDRSDLARIAKKLLQNPEDL